MTFASQENIKTQEQQIADLIELNQKITAEVASLRAELATQKALVAELLKRLYGTKSEQIDTNQLLLTFLEGEAKKPEATASAEDPGLVA